MLTEDSINPQSTVEQVITSLSVHKYEQIDINDELLFVPEIILEVIDSLNQQLEKASGIGISNN